ncbi:hypothetical protein SUGI_1125530 [Cryptomeria japonica]|nr:hypothetical protein SUGI_1125530 [Cryptomeria japonica]
MPLKIDFLVSSFAFGLLLFFFCDGGEGGFLSDNRNITIFPHGYRSLVSKGYGSVQRPMPQYFYGDGNNQSDCCRSNCCSLNFHSHACC